MEVSLTSVCCDFLSSSIRKAPFREYFFEVTWIRISDPRGGEFSFKKHGSPKIVFKFHSASLAVLLFLAVTCVSQSFFHEVVSQTQG